MLNSLSEYSSAIQALSAMAVALLTLALILVTHRYARSANRMLDLSQFDLALRLRPHVAPRCSLEWNGRLLSVRLRLENRGLTEAIVRRVTVYCTDCTDDWPYRQHVATEWFQGRLIPSGGTIQGQFEIDLVSGQEDQGSSNKKDFEVEVVVTDALGIGTFAYSLNEAEAITYLAAPFVPRSPSLKSRIRSARWRLKKLGRGIVSWRHRQLTVGDVLLRWRQRWRQRKMSAGDKFIDDLTRSYGDQADR